MQFEIMTIFPHILDSYFHESILGRAQKAGLLKIRAHDIRAVAGGRHRSVDDKPYGGGPGMVMMVKPIYKTLKKIKRAKKSKVILLDPAGEQFSQPIAKNLAKLDQLIFVAGRYEGVDARVEEFIDEKISIGPYVLSGGELAAAVIIEAVARLIPGVLGNRESLTEETFSQQPKAKKSDLKIFKEYPHYTRPEIFSYRHRRKIKKLKVPRVLLSGNHRTIKDWRHKNSFKKDSKG